MDSPTSNSGSVRGDEQGRAKAEEMNASASPTSAGPSMSVPVLDSKGRPALRPLFIPYSSSSKTIPLAHQMPRMVRRTRVRPSLRVTIPVNSDSVLKEATRGEGSSPDHVKKQCPNNLDPTSSEGEEELTAAFAQAFADHQKKRDAVQRGTSAASSELRTSSSGRRRESPEPEYVFSPSPRPLAAWNDSIDRAAGDNAELRRALEREQWILALQMSGDEGFLDYLHLYTEHSADSPIDWRTGECSCYWSRSDLVPINGLTRHERSDEPDLTYSPTNANTESLPSTAPWPSVADAAQSAAEGMPDEDNVRIYTGSQGEPDDSESSQDSDSIEEDPRAVNNQGSPREIAIVLGSPEISSGFLQQQQNTEHALPTFPGPAAHTRPDDSSRDARLQGRLDSVAHPATGPYQGSDGYAFPEPPRALAESEFGPYHSSPEYRSPTRSFGHGAQDLPEQPQRSPEFFNIDLGSPAPQSATYSVTDSIAQQDHEISGSSTRRPAHPSGGTSHHLVDGQAPSRPWPEHINVDAPRRTRYTFYQLSTPSSAPVSALDEEADLPLTVAELTRSRDFDLESGLGSSGSSRSAYSTLDPLIPRQDARQVPRRFLQPFTGEQVPVVLVVLLVLANLLLFVVLYVMIVNLHL
ncbi:hypothetical protein NLU13_4344 [Sarocladium strictum]|uniref:Uncharacterized protein n=1 Tax=Sarocladium strictum TaxID=5046 RepID=A0AA39L8Q9_SARSR|nr:hypothetical protein NLU13_4344 [Sarocladium strictum]